MNQSSQRAEWHVPVLDASQRAAQLLAAASGLSHQQIKQAMHKGAVWRSRGRAVQRLRRGASALKAGDELHLYYDAKVLSEVAPEPTLIADEGQYSLWYKPYGLLSQGSRWGDHCTLGRWAELHLEPQRPAFIVHRLDRAASGLMLLAHGKGAARQLAQLFEQRRVEKCYQVLAEGRFAGEAGASDGPVRLEAPLDGKPAASLVSCLDYDAMRDRSLLQVQIETGRKHQIRRHLAGAGHPVVGDRLYGRATAADPDLQLTACLLAFICPFTHQARRYRLPSDLLPSLAVR